MVAHLGHRTGQHAPGLVNSGTEFDVIHHQLLAHGLAAQALRAGGPGGEVGIVLNLKPRLPRSDHPLDREAAALKEGLMDRWFLDPLLGRGYPDDLRVAAGWPASVVAGDDPDIIAQPLDSIGLNYYHTEVVGYPGLRDCDRPAPLRGPPAEVTEMGWPVTPAGLGKMLRMLDGYGLGAIYVTENGAAYPDTIHDGRIHDEDRCSYLGAHLVERSATACP